MEKTTEPMSEVDVSAICPNVRNNQTKTSEHNKNKHQTKPMRTNNHPFHVMRLPLWLLICGFCSAMAAQAATYYFIGNGNSGNRDWNLATSWTLSASGGFGGDLPSFASPGQDLVFGNYHFQENTLNARPRTGGPFYVNSMTFTCNGWLISQNNTDTNKIVLGAGGLINNQGNVTGTPTVANPGQLDNAFRTLIELSASATIWNYDTNQPLNIRHDTQYLTAGIKHCLDIKNFTLTFDGPGTNSFNVPGTGHAGGAITGTGNVVKNGTGLTSFNATNTYTGLTTINAGRLNVRTIASGGGAYTVANGAALGVTVHAVGTTLPISSLTLGSSTTNSLVVALGAFGNPTAPVVYATNLTINGTTYVSITGSGVSVGTITLVKYTNDWVSGAVANGLLPDGIVGYITNNTAAKEIQYVITKIPSLLWAGIANGITTGTWDIDGTSNWLDTANGSVPEYYNNALPVRFADGAATGFVTIATNLAPSSVTVSNNSLAYSFANDGVNGYQILPTAGLIKEGTGTLILGMSNSYTSFTSIKQGTIRAGAANAIGRGPGNSGANLTNNGTLDLNGFSQNIGSLDGAGVITNSSSSPVTLQAQQTVAGVFSGRIDEGSGGAITLNKAAGPLTLSGANRYSGGTRFVSGGTAASRQITLGGNNVMGTGPVYFEINAILAADASPRTLTNSISLVNANASITLGATNTGVLTLSGPIENSSAGGDQIFTTLGEVVLAGPFSSTSSGGLTGKDGPGTLRLKANTLNSANAANDMRVNDGTMIIDGATVNLRGPDNATTMNFRVQSQIANGTASLYVTNNGVLNVGNDIYGYGNLRLGDTSSPTGSTNIADIRGTLIANEVVMGYSNTNNAGSGKLARLNLQSGSQMTISQIGCNTNCRAVTELNLDGATINVRENAASAFLQGLTNVVVKSGGVTLNGANASSIHIRQNLLSGGGAGGVTWNGTNQALATETTLQLDGTNSYTGTTTINIGNLGGIGTLAGPVVLLSGTSLLPGGGGSIGTFTVSNNVTLNSGAHCSLELNTTNSLAQTDEFGTITNYVRLPNTNDMLVVSGILGVSGATLTVGNDGPNLVAGDYFKLFNKAVSGFSSVSLPGLDPGLAWVNNLAVDGSIRVAPAATLAYDGNGSASGSAPVDANSPYGSGSTVTVLGNTGGLTKTNYNFGGWNTAANGAGTTYQAGGTFTITANTTLYAKWNPATPPTLGVSQTGNVLTFTWAETGFHLQSQTNTLNTGLSNNWHDYPGGGTSGVTATIDPASPAVFFRLSQ
jgi:autotransporter-associated beta strand protein